MSASFAPAQYALPLDDPPDLIARLRAAGLPARIPVTLHANRRVMVSFDQRGGLRVHQGYAVAPDRIVAAIATWARPWVRRRDRKAAAQVFLEFSVHGDAQPAPKRRRDAAEPGDEERLERLRALRDALNLRWFDGQLAAIEIVLSSRMRRKLGHYEPASSGSPAIAISRRHIRRDGWGEVAETLLHEMVHQWQDESGLGVDHGPTFRSKAVEVGIEPRAVAGRPVD
ncbi:MAG: SprT-like domain-containing protein [Gemmatimonadales bacterium]|nr:SprT-like domain-containing protein [Gemmatimonadales bacterium]